LKCPHCLVAFHSRPTKIRLCEDRDGVWKAKEEICPSCQRMVLSLLLLENGNDFDPDDIKKDFMVYPKGISRSPLSSDVPEKFAQDYKEACLVLNDSPKASAALSRRCLQNILREVAKITKSDLFTEIGALLESKSLPTHLAKNVDVIRVLGNFAAHPIKSTSSGEIVDVEPGEAEWGLDVLEGLFDFYFIQPAKSERKHEALNKKLEGAGKQHMKE